MKNKKNINFNQKKKIYNKFFTCYYETNNFDFKAIIIVPKKFIKLAVKRNYYKRVFRAIILSISDLPKCTCYFFYNKIILSTKNVVFLELKKDLNKIVRKLIKII